MLDRVDKLAMDAGDVMADAAVNLATAILSASVPANTTRGELAERLLGAVSGWYVLTDSYVGAGS